MKITFAVLMSLICIQLFACSKNSKIEQTNHSVNTSNIDTLKIKITIGTNIFTATLDANATAKAFKAKLPMTITMAELNGNEKYFDLPGNLPANASKPLLIKNGDLMLYHSNTLVLFYKSFSTFYAYTSVAHIENPSGLAAALGSGNITVKFEVE